MTQHHDPVHPDDGDRDGPEEGLPLLGTEDEAYVRGLLATLPPVDMPADVEASLDAALARAAAERSLVPGATTVVPLDAARGRRARASGGGRARVLQAAAAVVLVVAGGVLAVDVLHSRQPTSSPAAGNAATQAAAVPIERTGHTYTDASLNTDVQLLAAHTLPTESAPPTYSGSLSAPGTETRTPETPPTSSDGSTPGSPAASAGGLRQLIFQTQAELVPCLTAVEDTLTKPVDPVAMDQGTYKSQVVLVVVLPSTQDANSYDVFIVGAACGKDQNADMLTYHLVPKG